MQHIALLLRSNDLPMSFLDPFRQFLQYLASQLQSQYYLYVIGALGAVLAFLLLYASSWGAAIYASRWFWPGLVLLLLVVSVLVIRYSTPRLREQIFVRRHDSQYVSASQESPAEFQAKFLRALDTLKSLPQLKGKDDPLYALPWYLLIGETKVGKTSALGATGLFSSLTPSSPDGGTQNCDWWISNTAVVLDTAGRYVSQADKARDRAEWYHLLRLLRTHRSYEPINGIVVALRADAVVTESKEQLRAAASQVRQRFQEIVDELGCDLPIYFLITHSDLIDGFREFFTQLPPRILREALGYVEEPPPSLSERTTQGWGDKGVERLRVGLATIYDRLHRFRLSLLDHTVPAELRQSIFCFPEEFKSFCESLVTFATPIFGYDVNYHTPLLRGVFFCSARQYGNPVSLLQRQFHVAEIQHSGREGETKYFLADVFQQLLPRDRGLITLTPREQKKRGVTKLFGTGSRVALLSAAVLLLLSAYWEDRRLVRAVDTSACNQGDIAVPPKEVLAQFDQCRQNIARLHEGNRKRPTWLTLWFTQSFHLAQNLQRRYVSDFFTSFLDIVNKNMDRIIHSRDDPVPFILLLARRLQISQRCLNEPPCPTELQEDEHPDYALMLTLHHASLLGTQAQELAALRSAYLSYLQWQDPSYSVLRQESDDNHRLLQKWLADGQFTWERLRDIANRDSSITYEKYWQRPLPIRVISESRVEASCTKNGWEKRIVPLLQPILDAAPDLNVQFKQFRAGHFTRCFEQWRRFLLDFPQGAESWQGTHDRQTLTLRILSESSPYQRVLTDAWENISGWLPQDAESLTVPAWLEQLKNYMSSDQRKEYRDSLQRIGEKLAETNFSETSFAFMKEILSEAKPQDEATNPLQRAWDIASQVAQGSKGSSDTANVDLFQPLLQEPLRFVLRVLLEHTDIYLRKAWQENVESALPGVSSPAERFAFLYAPGGKIETFNKQYLESVRKAKVPFGEKLSLAPHIAQALDTQRQVGPLFDSNIAQNVTIRTGRRPSITGLSPLVEDETFLSITCGGKRYEVSSRSGQEASMIVPWSYPSCGDVTLLISFYFFDRESRSGAAQQAATEKATSQKSQKIRLTKRYPGSTAFLYFLQDLRSGEHSFQMSDFEPDLDAKAVLQQGANSVKVYYRVSIPPTLEKLTAALQAATVPENKS